MAKLRYLLILSSSLLFTRAPIGANTFQTLLTTFLTVSVLMLRSGEAQVSTFSDEQGKDNYLGAEVLIVGNCSDDCYHGVGAGYASNEDDGFVWQHFSRTGEFNWVKLIREMLKNQTSE